MTYDKIILGAGVYGLYAALRCAQKGERVLVLEADPSPFARATFVNQARVHMGYHYPRSLSTAAKSAKYFKRFCDDFGDCINASFDQVYATSAAYSWTNAAEFRRFCRAAGIRCDELPCERYFKPGMCDGAFLTTEYTFDAQLMRDKLTAQLSGFDNASVRYGAAATAVRQQGEVWAVSAADGREYEAPFLLNATYASVNQITAMLGYAPFQIKYELCEIILCTVSDALQNTGITVMDGPFFSIMPFGKTGYHSLTSVTFTPHATCYEAQPRFRCQERAEGRCTPRQLGNCDACPAAPESAWVYMSRLAHKYLRDEFGFSYVRSHYSMKPILKASEIDDSRPTLVRVMQDSPVFVSVLSGKINTVYDLDEVL